MSALLWAAWTAALKAAMLVARSVVTRAGTRAEKKAAWTVLQMVAWWVQRLAESMDGMMAAEKADCLVECWAAMLGGVSAVH
jgi:hypothetical protein